MIPYSTGKGLSEYLYMGIERKDAICVIERERSHHAEREFYGASQLEGKKCGECMKKKRGSGCKGMQRDVLSN